MKCDKDRPSTWVSFKTDYCSTCVASCCMMPVEVTADDLVRLGLVDAEEISISPKRAAKNLIKQKIVSSYRESTGLFMFSQSSNGDCRFLHPVSRQCTVYEKRPSVCRDFPMVVGPRVTYCPYVRKG